MTAKKATVARDITIILGGLAITGLLYTFSAAYLQVPGAPGAKIPPAGPISLSGIVTCLPHKNTKGPQTLECAFGFQDEQGLYYGLRDEDPSYGTVSSVPMNVQVRVDGVFTPQNDTRYQSVGIIDVKNIAPEESGRRMGISGIYVCLPYRAEASSTGECQLGLRADDGTHYVVDLGPLSQMVPTPQVGDRLSAQGMYVPLEMISTDYWSAYDIQGIFSVTSITDEFSETPEPE